MNGSPRGLASCKGERTGDPYGAVSCAELMQLARRKGKPIPLAAGLRIVTEVLEHLDRAAAAGDGDGARDEWGAVSAQAILVGPTGDVSVRVSGAPSSESDGPPGGGTERSRVGAEQSGPFAVGAVLYEMLTGRRLFAGDQHDSLARADVADLSAIAQPTAQVPLEVRLILASALSREPETRFRGVRDFADAIHSFAQHAHVPLGASELTSWLATLDLWPAQSGMFPRSDVADMDGYPTTAAEDETSPDVRRRRAR